MKTSLRVSSSVCAAVVAAVLIGAAPAGAQQAGGTSGTGGGIAEIIVTARAREESLQAVPLAVTAFNADEISRSAVFDLKDVARFTAGFNFEDFSGGFGTPVIRSATQNRLTALEQNVSVFFDRVYLPRSYLYALPVGGIDRIEVVKGPQSARYGRNAFMGAINYVPLGPTEDFRADAMAGIGDDERYELAGSIGGPLVEGLLSGHAYVGYEEYDGPWTNSHPLANAGVSPGTDGNLGGFDNQYFSGALRLTPVDGLAIDLRYYDFQQDNEIRPISPNGTGLALNNLNCGTQLQPGDRFRLLCGEIPYNPGPYYLDPRSYAANTETSILRAEIEWQITDAFSVDYLYANIEGEVASVTASDVDQRTCGDNNPGNCTFQNVPNGDVDYDTHELRFLYKDGPLLAGFGAFYLDGDDLEQFAFGFLPPATTPPVTPFLDPISFPGAFLLTNALTTTRDISYYGEIQYGFLDERLRLGAEVRYTEEKKTVTNLTSGANFERTFYQTTPRFTVDYDLTDDNLLYFSLARGLKAGGFNPTAFLPENLTYEPDDNWTYELGAKNLLWDQRLQLNVAAFYTAWSDLQVNKPNEGSPTAATAAQIIGNAGDATLYGLEIEATALLTERLQANIALSLTDATFDSGTIDGVAIRQPTPCDDIVCPSDGNIGGNDLPRQSSEQLAVGLQWGDQLGVMDADYYIRTDVAYQSEQYLTSLNEGTIPSRVITNATIGFTRGNYELQLWARNLLDEEYVSSAFATVTPFASAYNGTLGEPRTLGLRLRARFQ